MLAKTYMVKSDGVYQVQPWQTLEDAFQVMSLSSYKALPVVEGDRLAGVLKKVDVYDAYYHNKDRPFTDFLQEHRVLDFMKKDVEPLRRDERFSSVLLNMEKLDIDFLPICEEDKFAGIITRNSVLKAFQQGMGLEKSGYVIELLTVDIQGRLLDLAQILNKHGANVLNIMVFDLHLMKLDRIIVKLETDDVEALKNDILKHGFQVGEYYFEDALTKMD